MVINSRELTAGSSAPGRCIGQCNHGSGGRRLSGPEHLTNFGADTAGRDVATSSCWKRPPQCPIGAPGKPGRALRVPPAAACESGNRRLLAASADTYVENIKSAREIAGRKGFAKGLLLQALHQTHLNQAIELASTGVLNLRHGDATMNMAAQQGADWNRDEQGPATPLSAEIHEGVMDLAKVGLIKEAHAKTATTTTYARDTGKPISSSRVHTTGTNFTQELSRRLDLLQKQMAQDRVARRKDYRPKYRRK